MYYYNHIFNPQYVSRSNYLQLQNEIARYQANQNFEVVKAVKAMHDLCEAIKNMDTEHQEQAAGLCLAEIVREFNL